MGSCGGDATDLIRWGSLDGLVQFFRLLTQPSSSSAHQSFKIPPYSATAHSLHSNAAQPGESALPLLFTLSAPTQTLKINGLSATNGINFSELFHFHSFLLDFFLWPDTLWGSHVDLGLFKGEACNILNAEIRSPTVSLFCLFECPWFLEKAVH